MALRLGVTECMSIDIYSYHLVLECSDGDAKGVVGHLHIHDLVCMLGIIKHRSVGVLSHFMSWM